jgi:hypothetical protein
MVERSLVVTDGDDGYRMLDSLRAYADAALQHDRADHDATYGRLSSWSAECVAAADSKLRGPEQQAAPAQLRRQVPNLRARAGVVLHGRRPRARARLAASLAWFWALVGDNQETNPWLHKALGAPGIDVETRAQLLERAGIHTLVLGNVAEAQRLLQESTGLWRDAGAPERSVVGLIYLGVTHRWFECLGPAAAIQDESISLARKSGDDWGLAWSLLWRAGTAADDGDEVCVPKLLASHGNVPRRPATRASSVGSSRTSRTPPCARGRSIERSGCSTSRSSSSRPQDGTKGWRPLSPRWGGPCGRRGALHEAGVHHGRALRTATELG